ncbi:hypothetical protein ACFL02_03605 [Planctomycetota bacterium]
MYRNNIKIMILAIGLLLLSSLPKTQGEQLQWQPVKVGKGPLLFFFHPEDREGKPFSGIGRRDVLYVYDPTIDQPPQRVWHQFSNCPVPLVRLDPNNVLFEYRDHLFIVDLTQGKSSGIMKTNNQVEFVAVEGQRVYFLEKIIPYTIQDMGIKLGRGKSGNTVVQEYYQPQDYIYVLDRSKSEIPKRLTGLKIEKVLYVDEKQLWVITAGEDRKLYRIEKNGNVEDIITFDPHWITPRIEPKFSPDQRYLALGIIHDQHDFHSERELVVIDLEQKNIVFVKERMLLFDFSSVGGSNIPLLFNWTSDTKLGYINGDFSMGFLDVETGEDKKLRFIKDPEKITGQPTSPPTRKTQGYFDREDSTLFFQGEDAPVGKYSKLAVNPNGEWAAFLSSEDKNVYLADGRKKEKALLINGWSYDLKWLSSIK